MSYKDKTWKDFPIPLFGDHNALNALASFACAHLLGFKDEEILKALPLFKGVKRRRERKGQDKERLFFDDYAHHPVELKAVLSSLKEEFPEKRLVALFQPHRYSRFRDSWDQFLECFSDADKLFVLPVYPAGEEFSKQYNTEKEFLEQINHPEAHFIDYEKASSFLKTKNFKERRCLCDFRSGFGLEG